MYTNEFAQGQRLDPEIKDFLDSPLVDLVRLYCETDPDVDKIKLIKLLSAETKHFRFSGSDFLRINKRPGFALLEINSAPGFAYCTPALDSWNRVYKKVAEWICSYLDNEARGAFYLITENKVPCETYGFQRAFSEILSRPVQVLGPRDLLSARMDGSVLSINGCRILSGLRYLHDNSWKLLPPGANGQFFNPTTVDLLGARNKIAAHEVFTQYNSSCSYGIPAISTIPSRVVNSNDDLEYFEAGTVLKQSCLNSGRGIRFVVDGPKPDIACNPLPLLVQELIRPAASRFNSSFKQILVDGYVHDIRMVVANGSSGFFPLMVYARRASHPYSDDLRSDTLMRSLLTNIAVVDTNNNLRLQCERLVLPSPGQWFKLGLCKRDLAVMFVQTSIAMLAIDYAVNSRIEAGLPESNWTKVSGLDAR